MELVEGPVSGPGLTMSVWDFSESFLERALRSFHVVHMAVAQKVAVGSTPMGSHFGVGAPPILVDFSGDWDVHWGYDLGFDT